jgi:hypothetical protein
MTSQYRHRRTSNPATPAPNPLEPGEIAVNTANRQLHLGDAAAGTLGAPKAMIAIRYFDTAAQYVTNDFVVNGTSLFRAKNATGPGAFVAADWAMMVGVIDPQYVAKAGDVMSGMLTLPATAPSVGTHATNKTYVDNLVALKSSVIVSDVKPSPDPIDSTLWYCTLDGQLYIRYNDGNSTTWVIAAPQPDSSNYVSLIGASAVRYDAAQALTAAQQVQARQNIFAAPMDALAYSGMQINGSMDVSQENGAGNVPVVPGSIKNIIDGWKLQTSGVQSFNAFQNPSGPPGFPNSLMVVPTIANVAPGATDYAALVQYIEGYRVSRLGFGAANAQPITIGFWVYSALRTGTLPVSLRNIAGNRSYVVGVPINAAATFEYKTITVPGDTTGAWPKDNATGLILTFGVLSGSNFVTAPNAWTAGNFMSVPGAINFATTAGSDGLVITGVVVLPGIEAPSAARSALIMRPFDQELVACQRYFEPVSNAVLGWVAAPTNISLAVPYRAVKRTSPTLFFVPSTITVYANANFTSTATPTIGAVDATGATINIAGFSGMTVNNPAVLVGNAANIRFDARF